MQRGLLVLVLAAACLGSACAPHHPPETAAGGQGTETADRSGQGLPGRRATGSSSGTQPTPGPTDPGTGIGDPGSGTGAGGGCPTGCSSPPPGCVIKGNINLKTGERVYHVPGQKYYDGVTIEPESGERWFCTESEAEANGWRRSRK